MMRSSTEEKRIEKKEERARESGSPNGAAPHAQEKTGHKPLPAEYQGLLKDLNKPLL